MSWRVKNKFNKLKINYQKLWEARSYAFLLAMKP